MEFDFDATTGRVKIFAESSADGYWLNDLMHDIQEGGYEVRVDFVDGGSEVCLLLPLVKVNP